MGSIKNILITFLLSSTLAGASSSDECFVIEKGILKNYVCQDTEITIPSNVIEIAVDALSQKGLTQVIFHHNLKIIRADALSYNELSHVDLPPLEVLEDRAFFNNPIQTLIIPLTNLSKIGTSVFDNEIYQEICPDDVKSPVRHKACPETLSTTMEEYH